MRKSIVVTCFLAVSVLSFASSALAIEGMYVAGNVGAVMLSDSETNTIFGKVGFDTGYGITAAVGRKVEYVRMEGEFNYRVSDIEKWGSDSASGDVKTFGFMLNTYFDINTNTSFTPFIGGGIGVANVDAEIENAALGQKISDDETVFAYQGIVGVAFAINKNSSIDLSYRYYATSDPDFDGVDGEYKGNNLMLGIRYSF